MFKYRLEERPVVQHQADGSYMDIVELFPFREIPRFIDVYILEPKIWGAWHFQLDGVDVNSEDFTFRVLVREVYRPYASACCRSQTAMSAHDDTHCSMIIIRRPHAGLVCSVGMRLVYCHFRLPAFNYAEWDMLTCANIENIAWGHEGCQVK